MSSQHAPRNWIVERFLVRYFADEDAGSVGPLANYQAQFPGHEKTIAQAWAELTTGAGADGTANERIGSFRLVREIGRGGQSIVYEAEDTRVGRNVAVKLLSSARWIWTQTVLRRFRREAEIAGRLQHPGICAVFEADFEDGVPYIVMPLLSGRTLAAVLREDEPPSRDRVLGWIREVARTIGAAHDAGIIHRDLKPSNVMVTEAGRTVVMDFGIARDASADVATLTGTGDLVGTLPYMAPEQVQGERVDERADVYALGVTLFECIAGRLPFDEHTQRATMNAIVRTTPPGLRKFDASISRDLEVVVHTALAKDPARRFKSMAAFADELDRLGEGRPILSRPAGPLVRLGAWRRRNPALAVSLAAVVVTLVAGLLTSLFLLRNVERERTRKQLALEEIANLTDITLLEGLIREIAEFEPPRPAKVAAMRAWLSRADAVAARAPLHRAALTALRENALPYGDAERAADWDRDDLMPEFRRLERSHAFLTREIAGLEQDTNADAGRLEHRRRELEVVERVQAAMERRLERSRSFAFAEPGDQWRHDLQAKLVAAMDGFLSEDAYMQTRARVVRLLALAERLARESNDEAWRQCRTRVSANRHYRDRDIELVPQFALVPLGPDPDSGLEEFVDLQTGVPPGRDSASGRLQLDADSGVVFVLLPGATARIGAIAPTLLRPAGSPHVDALARPVEGPVHDVVLDPFLISKFEVTQSQWLRVTGRNPSQNRIGVRYGGQPPVTGLHPVEGVSWKDAVHVLVPLGFDLPTSSQWEYAARAGTTTVFVTGETPKSLQGFANIADISYTRIGKRRATRELRILNDGWASHAPVGTFRANSFGLHDVIGNVQEWCRDKDHRYGFHWLPGDAMRVMGSRLGRVIRGASFLMVWSHARSANYSVLRPTLQRQDAGVRPIRVLQTAK